MADITCERCKERPAKNFICQIIDDEQRNLSLCEECFRTDRALSSDTPVFDGTEQCYYCGGPARSGRLNDEEE
jgi:protein-arginine kinase activator protein McsA